MLILKYVKQHILIRSKLNPGGYMPYPKGHKERTKKKIVLVAKELFSYKGFDNVSIDELMENSGLSRGVFYTYFSNKEELFIEAISTGVAPKNSSELWRSFLDNSDSNLEAMIKSYMSDLHLNSPHGGCPLFSFPNEVARGSQELKKSYKKVAESITFQIENSTEEGSIKNYSLAILSTIVGAMIISRAVTDNSYSRKLRSQCIDFILSKAH